MIQIGRGAYAQVFKSYHKGRKQTIVAKRIVAHSAAQVEKILREAQILQHLEVICQPFLLCRGELCRSATDPSAFWILSEFLGDFDTLADRMSPINPAKPERPRPCP